MARTTKLGTKALQFTIHDMLGGSPVYIAVKGNKAYRVTTEHPREAPRGQAWRLDKVNGFLPPEAVNDVRYKTAEEAARALEVMS